jgi:hypothetical protein
MDLLGKEDRRAREEGGLIEGGSKVWRAYCKRCSGQIGCKEKEGR